MKKKALRDKIMSLIHSGKAFERFKEILVAQKADINFIENFFENTKASF